MFFLPIFFIQGWSFSHTEYHRRCLSYLSKFFVRAHFEFGFMPPVFFLMRTISVTFKSLKPYLFTTLTTSHLFGCSLLLNYVAQSSSSPTGWLYPHDRHRTHFHREVKHDQQSRLVSVLHAWTANPGAHTSSCVCTTSERRRHNLRSADHNRACTSPYSKF